jgi:hypothetical protein
VWEEQQAVRETDIKGAMFLESLGLKGVDAFLQRRKDKPREDLLIALLALRQDMRDCHRSYLEFAAFRDLSNSERKTWRKQRRNAVKAGLPPSPDPKEVWIDAIRRLYKDVYGIDSVLQIYSPETRSAVVRYTGTDPTADSEVEQLFPDPATFYSTLGMDPEKTKSLGIDLKEQREEPEFDEVLEKLDAFIKETFKSEEVFHALSKLPR